MSTAGWLPLALLVAAVAACDTTPRPRAPETVTLAPAAPLPDAAERARTGSACAADAPWLAEIGQPIPALSTVMHFDRLRARGPFGEDGPVQTYRGWSEVTRQSEEEYEWPGPGPWDSPIRLAVLRNASGPIPKGYEPPILHASGVAEHREPADDVFRRDPLTLFVFPDGTWVRAGGELADRVRERFAIAGEPPPLPDLDPDVAWELCGDIDVNEVSLPFDVWTIRGRRVAVRLFASRVGAELVYPFDSPALAAKAAAEQASLCERHRCPWLEAASTDGAFVRYAVSVREAPAIEHPFLAIAHTTPRFAAAPPADAPVVPGTPPSGVYEKFVNVVSDSCPTHAAGQPFPSMHDLVLITHKGGAPTADLGAVEPRAPGLYTSSTLNDVALQAGQVARKEARHLCDNYTITWETTVLAATGNTIRYRNVVSHDGSTKGCRNAQLPSNCRHEALVTMVLARKSCDAQCDARVEGRTEALGSDGPAPRIAAVCTCP